MAGIGLERELSVYLAHVTVERGLSSHTVAAYRRDLLRYCDFLRALGRQSLSAATTRDVEEFAQAVSAGSDGAAPLAQASQARIVVAVRGWHRFSVAEGWSVDDAAAAVRPRQAPQRLPKALTVEQVESLLEAAAQGGSVTALRDRALLELLYATGARVSEATGLDIDDVRIDADGGAVLLRGKGNKERLVPLGGYARAAIEAYVVRARPALALSGTGTPALFLNARGGRLSRQSGWTILRECASRVGIDDVSPHTMRHSFATHLLRGGADIRVVQELLGHASVTTTQVYTLVTRDSLREVYQAAHPRANAPARERAE